jgi:hypothetical protein
LVGLIEATITPAKSPCGPRSARDNGSIDWPDTRPISGLPMKSPASAESR